MHLQLELRDHSPPMAALSIAKAKLDAVIVILSGGRREGDAAAL